MTLFYGYHLFTEPAFLLEHFGRGALTATRVPSSVEGIWALFVEAFWAFSPLISLVLLSALAFAAFRRQREHLYIILPLAAHALFYAGVHKHSYYLLGLLPFAAILTAQAVDTWLGASARTFLTGAVLLSGAFVSLVDLTSMKLGFSEFAQLGAQASVTGSGPRSYLLDKVVLENAFPVVAYYEPAARLQLAEGLRAADDGRLLPSPASTRFLMFTSPQDQGAPGVELFTRTRFGVTLFGLTIASAHANPNFFRQGAYLTIRTGNPWEFRFTPLKTYPALASIPLGQGWEVYRTMAGLELREGSPPAPGP